MEKNYYTLPHKLTRVSTWEKIKLWFLPTYVAIDPNTLSDKHCVMYYKVMKDMVYLIKKEELPNGVE